MSRQPLLRTMQRPQHVTQRSALKRSVTPDPSTAAPGLGSCMRGQRDGRLSHRTANRQYPDRQTSAHADLRIWRHHAAASRVAALSSRVRGGHSLDGRASSGDRRRDCCGGRSGKQGGGLHPPGRARRGPQWAFLLEMSKLNTESPPHGVRSPMLPDRNVGRAWPRLRGVGGLNLWHPWGRLPHWGPRAHFFWPSKLLIIFLKSKNSNRPRARRVAVAGLSLGIHCSIAPAATERGSSRKDPGVFIFVSGSAGGGGSKLWAVGPGTAWPCRINGREIPKNFFLMQLVRAVAGSQNRREIRGGGG